MKIAIHHRAGSFSQHWIEHCQHMKLPYKIVNCFDNNIISQLCGFNGLMWHWAQWDSRSILFARQLTYTIENIGLKVFPNSKTCWHFDDKVGQKYLLESIKAPLVPSYIFYEKEKALNWATSTEYPKVFKLRGGASSVNVQIIKNQKHAISIIEKAFSTGYLTTNIANSLKDRLINYKNNNDLESFIHVLKGFARLIIPKYDDAIRPRDRGYVYFQDYIPNNKFDIRVIVIGHKAFAIKRMIRKNDFRASGSGIINYNELEIPLECIILSFKFSNKIASQCLAFDYLIDRKKPLITEISYSFSHDAYLKCPGYWDEQLNWNKTRFTPGQLIIEDFIDELKLIKP